MIGCQGFLVELILARSLKIKIGIFESFLKRNIFVT
jgi:hypothetical protein